MAAWWVTMATCSKGYSPLLVLGGTWPHVHLRATWGFSLSTFSSLEIFLQVHSCRCLDSGFNHYLLFLTTGRFNKGNLFEAAVMFGGIWDSSPTTKKINILGSLFGALCHVRIQFKTGSLFVI